MLLFYHLLLMQAVPLNKQAVAWFFLGHFFGDRGGFRHFMVRIEQFRVNPDHPDRERRQRMMNDAALAIAAQITADRAMILIEQCRGSVCKSRECAIATLLPIRALQDQDKIVTADMTDKVMHRIADIAEQPGGELDQLITFAIAAHIVEGFEVVEVAITDGE